MPREVPHASSRLRRSVLPPSSYAEVNAEPFGRRVFVYVPPFKGKGFQPFQLWVVEGVYGRPFVQSSGVLDEASFAKLRASANVSATPVSVSRGDGTDVGRFMVSRVAYQLQVLRVKGGVQLRVCR